MIGSLFAGISGLNANATAMTVIGDNIANVNTNGYKRDQAVLAEGVAGDVRVNLRKDLSPAPQDPLAPEARGRPPAGGAADPPAGGGGGTGAPGRGPGLQRLFPGAEAAAPQMPKLVCEQPFAERQAIALLDAQGHDFCYEGEMNIDAALVELADVWPSSTPFSALVHQARSRLALAPVAGADEIAQASRALAQSLLMCHLAGLVELRYQPSEAVLAQLEELHQADLVGRRLAGQDDIALDR